MSPREADIARDLLPEIESRLSFLEEVGLSYLTLDRGAPTLSGGEAQRIRLAAQLGSATCKACVTCWTSPPSACTRATTRSCWTRLHKLGDMGNTLVVVEHDEDTIRRADHIIDIGPSAGKRGGRVVAQGHGGRPVGERRLAHGPLPAARDEAPAAAAARRHRRR